jgi:hypothetical protein
MHPRCSAQTRAWSWVSALVLLGGVACGSDGGGEGTAGSGGSGGSGADLMPASLSETGLYAPGSTTELAAGVVEYAPRYELWSDGADKRRWLQLPPGQPIDTSDIDHWRFPQGTKVWKEFSRDGTRLETRLLWKTGGNWTRLAYAWDEAQRDAFLAANRGEKDALGTSHDIPSRTACDECHEGVPDVLLGVSAIQLSHDGPGLTLRELAGRELLSDPPASGVEFRLGDGVAADALGYMHANCGNCHSPTSATWDRLDLDLWLRTAEITQLESTGSYRSTVGIELTEAGDSGLRFRVVAGDAEASGLVYRMALRGEEEAMPPLASEELDAQGMRLVRDWIDSL